MWTSAILMGVAALAYLPTGVLLVTRANYEPLCRRSPWLVLISHVANFVEVELFLVSRMEYSNEASYLQIYQAVMAMAHYLFYFPYLLRSYRLYFVFELGQHWLDADKYFFSLRHRAKQSWLIKVLLLLMTPVIIISVCLLVLPGFSEIYPSTYSESEGSVASMEAFIILLYFIEELIFILAVWKLRNVNDDFAMTSELVWVCMLWMTNSFMLTDLFPLNYWLYQAIIRNFLIMLVSSFWPVLKSFGQPHVEVPLTVEALHSLELVVLNETSLEAFSAYLRSGNYDAELSKLNVKTQQLGEFECFEGYWLLEFWLSCEVFKFNPTPAKRNSLINNFIANGHLRLPVHITAHLNNSSVPTTPGLFMEAQEYALTLLSEHYFPLFQLSSNFSDLIKEVTRQNIRLTRLASTSFLGSVRNG